MTSNFLDNTCTKVQNMAFKTSQMDQIALESWYYGSLGRLRVDGRGFPQQTPILKNCSPERNQVAANAQKRVTVPLKGPCHFGSDNSSCLFFIRLPLFAKELNVSDEITSKSQQNHSFMSKKCIISNITDIKKKKKKVLGNRFSQPQCIAIRFNLP